jgi:O-methyltransferase
MMGWPRQWAARLGRRLGYEVSPIGPAADMEPAFLPIYAASRPFTMGTTERLYALFKAVEHVEARGVEGAIVECGVWRGGSAMCCALALRALASTERALYLYDTFTGMAEPGPRDTDFRGRSAHDIWRRSTQGSVTDWCLASEDEARANVLSTGYPAERMTIVAGRVEETIPAVAPDKIAVLRLDTDWYDSTRHELVHLFPRLSAGGVLIVDDYGYWRGAREATDEYLRDVGAGLLLCRIDHAARQGVKQ